MSDGEGAWTASNRCAGSPAQRTTCRPCRPRCARAVGYALFAAQQGEKHDDAKVLKGFGDAAVLEVIARHHGDTFLVSEGRYLYRLMLKGEKPP